MASALKCPNPSCPFLFDPTQVPPGAVLTCPRCTMRFTLGTTGAVPPANEFETPAKTNEPEAPAEKPSILSSRTTLIMGIAAAAAVLFAVLALFFSGRPGGGGGDARDKRFAEINLLVRVPEGWESDEALKAQMKLMANVMAMKKAESSARFVLGTENYEKRAAQSGELKTGVDQRLRMLFEDLEVTESEGTWLGQPARKFTFRGRGLTTEGNFAGEAYAVGAHGRAYWFLGWSLESDWATQGPDLEAISTGCKLIDPKLVWKPSTSGSATIANDDGDYRVTDGDLWWEKQSDPKTEDAKADLLLRAKFRTRPMSDRPPQAWAAAYLLEGDDPMTALRDHVKARYAKVFEIKKLTDVTDEMQGDPPAAGMPADPPAQRFRGEHGDPNIEKLVVLYAVKTEKGIVGIEAWCPWSDRAKWEKKLVALASSLTSAK